MKRNLLTLAIVASLVGCGGGGGSDNDAPVGGGTGGGGGDTGGEYVSQVSGTAMAPGGSVAQFEQPSLLQYAVHFLVSPVAAAITGLEPVNGALVELIRVDNTGVQFGDVITTAYTSTTGDYTLSIPAGVNLSGDLVVRITGNTGAAMRAQVVDQKVNITPVSEFVLRSFIDNGADLKNLTTSAVVKVSGQVEQFNLAAAPGSDLSAMLAQLEEETKDFMDEAVTNAIASVPTKPADTASIAGQYRNVAFGWSLRDSDGNDGTRFHADVWLTDIEFQPGTNGIVTFLLTNEEDAGVARYVNSAGTYFDLWYETEIEPLDESFDGAYNDKGVLSLEFDFEEEIDGEHAYRFVPSTFSLQKAKDKSIFIAPSSEVDVEYETVDEDGDGVGDGKALDPSKRRGDEISRGLEIFLKKPTDASNDKLVGNFGRVYMGSSFYDYGSIEIETEQNVLTFDGAGSLSESAAPRLRINRNNAGEVTFTGDDPASAGEGISYTLNSDGSFEEIDGGGTNAFVNDTYDLFVVSDMSASPEGTNNVSESEQSITLGVKLPTQPLTLTDKVYRVIGSQLDMSDAKLGMNQFHFGSLLKITGATSATLTGGLSEIQLEDGAENLESGSTSLKDAAVAVDLKANGQVTFSVAVPDGALTLTGFLNQSGSLGVMQYYYQPTGEDPVALGLAMLVEVNL